MNKMAAKCKPEFFLKGNYCYTLRPISIKHLMQLNNGQVKSDHETLVSYFGLLAL